MVAVLLCWGRLLACLLEACIWSDNMCPPPPRPSFPPDDQLDKEDVKAYWKRFKTALTHNLPAGGGFTGGFALGLCCG